MKTGTRSRRVGIGALVTTLSMVIASPASAAEAVDQSNVVAAGIASAQIINNFWSQTFTAGVSGTASMIELDLAGTDDPAPGNLVVEVREVSGGVPTTGTPLASATLTEADIPDDFVLNDVTWTPVQLSFEQTAGSQYAIVLNAPDASNSCGTSPCGYRWRFSGENQYAAGGLLFSADGTSWADNPGLDAGFRTYVNDAPEPAPTVQDLADDVTALGLSDRDTNSLLKPLELAQKHLDAGRLDQGCAKIDQFAGRVSSMAADGTISQADADALLADTQAVKDDLGCPTA